jgi:hypothetical protein
MATNKDIIECLEADMQELREGIQQIRVGTESRKQSIEDTLSEIWGVFSKNLDGSNHSLEKAGDE